MLKDIQLLVTPIPPSIENGNCNLSDIIAKEVTELMHHIWEKKYIHKLTPFYYFPCGKCPKEMLIGQLVNRSVVSRQKFYD